MSPLYPIIILTITLLGLLTGSLLIFFGIRGRLFLGQARCNACGYHLGPNTTTSSACQECGTSLSSPKALRFDRRVRSKLKVVIGVVIFFLSMAFPIGTELARLALRDNTSMAFLNGGANTGKATWMRPMDETPDKNRHWQYELNDVTTDDLIVAIGIRPEDRGIWQELRTREMGEGLTTVQVRAVFESFVDFKTKRATKLNQRWGNDIGNIYSRVLYSFDPSDESDISMLNSVLGSDLIIDHIANTPVIVASNKTRELSLSKPYGNFPNEWIFRLNGCEVKRNGKIVQKKAGSTPYENISLTLPSIPFEELHQDQTITITPDITITSPASVGSDQPIIWNLQPQMEFQLQVVPPGETAAVYHEWESLPESYIEAFKRTKVAAWSLQDSDETMLAIDFSYPHGSDEPGTLHMSVIPNISNKGEINRGNNLTYAFGDGWMSGTSNTTKTYLLPKGFDQDTIDVVLEPRLMIIPGKYAKQYGILGSRVVIENIPVSWIDRATQSSVVKNPTITVRNERIGRGEDAEGTSIAGPLFGPAPISTVEDSEGAALLAQWLQPTLLTWTNSKGKRWAQFQYGSKDTLPLTSQLRISIDNPGKSPFIETIELTPATAKNIGNDIPERGAYWFNPVDEELLPGTMAKIEARGFPGSLRRDKRDQEPWFGGTFTLEIPVVEGKYDKTTRRLYPVSGAEEDS